MIKKSDNCSMIYSEFVSENLIFRWVIVNMTPYFYIKVLNIKCMIIDDMVRTLSL